MKTITGTISYVKQNSIVFSTVIYYIIWFALPLNLPLTKAALFAFMAVWGFYNIINLSGDFFNMLVKEKRFITVISLPFLLLLFGSLYSEDTKEALKEIGNLFPVLVMGLLIIFSNTFFRQRWQHTLLFFVAGNLLLALISWGIAFYEMAFAGDPVLMLFTAEYGSHNLVDTMGMHTPYVAFFTLMSLGFIVYFLHNPISNISNSIWYIAGSVLLFFLLNLMARNAIFSFVFFGLCYILARKKFLILIGFVLLLAAFTWFSFTTEKNYYRDRFFKSVNLFEKETIFSKKDNRFDRLEASYKVFEQFPILGPGAESEDFYRKQIYYENRDSEAYNRNYNAHNQFMEYLSTYGLLGGILYMTIFVYLYVVSFVKRSYLLGFMVTAFFIANLTESMLERSWGILFYIFLLMISYCLPRHKTKSYAA